MKKLIDTVQGLFFCVFLISPAAADSNLLVAALGLLVSIGGMLVMERVRNNYA